jgi:hypothetical protein
METVVTDLAALLSDVPRGAWAAISEQRHTVVSFGTDAQTVLDRAHEMGEPHPLIVRVPEQSLVMCL